MEKSAQKLVFIAEDDMVTRFLIKRILENFNDCSAELFENAKLMNDAMQVHTPDYVFMDVNMPEMDAYQFLEQHQKGKEQIFILLGAPLPPEKEEWFLKQGVNGFILKPLTEENFRELLVWCGQ